MTIQFEEIFPASVYVYRNIVDIPLASNNEIDKIVDKIRVAKGKRPFFPTYKRCDYCKESYSCYDLDAWYNARLLINKDTKEPITIQVVTENDEDNDVESYFLSINKEDIAKQVKSELKKYGITLEWLIEQDEDIF